MEGADVFRAQFWHIAARYQRGQQRSGYKHKHPYQLVHGHHRDHAKPDEVRYAENAESFHEEAVQPQRRVECVDLRTRRWQ
jgi:hypothetical protein